MRMHVLVLLLGSWPRVAAAEPTARSALVVTRGLGAEDCPTAEALALKVRAITPKEAIDVTLGPDASTRIYVQLGHELGRYEAVIQLQGRRQGARTLTDAASNCESLADAVSLTLAMLLDTGPPAPIVPLAPKPWPRAAPPLLTRTRFRPRWGASTEAGVGVRWLKDAAPLSRVSVVLDAHSRIRFAAGITVLMPQRARYEEGYTTLRLTSAYAQGCGRLVGSSALAFFWCFEPTLGVLSGAGQGYEETHERSLAWAALSTGARLEGSFTAPAFWSLSALGTIPFTHRGFAISSQQEQHRLFEVPRPGLLASLGVGVWF